MTPATPPPQRPYQLPDYSVGEAGANDPLQAYSWQELREIIYEDPTPRLLLKVR